MDLKETAILGDQVDRHWYYRSKATAVCRYVKEVRPSSILDVGAGSAFFTKYLLTHTNAQRGLCVDTGYAHDSDESLGGKSLKYRRSCGSVDADLVLLMDVLEHVEDDRELLGQYARKVARGAHFMITVPAFQWLWSNHDVFLEHYRRYDISRLESVVSEVGLETKCISYYFASVFPIAAALRVVRSLPFMGNRLPRSELRLHSRLVNGSLSLVCRAELAALRFNRIAGLSVFCLARKL